MNILWITNIIFPYPSKLIKVEPSISGGWMYLLSKQLSEKDGIHIGIATIYKGKKLLISENNNITYFLLPSNLKFNYEKKLEKHWGNVIKQFNPDIVHIHGTELPHGLACMRVFPSLNYIISIQGLVSIISRYYYAGMSFKDIFTHITLRDLIKRDTIFQTKKKFLKRGVIEKEYFNRSKNVIGRTSWDYCHSKSFNPSINYFYCNESLRPGFYNADKWNIKNKTSYSLFLSQSSYPIKGVHQIFKAVALLKEEFPLITIRIAGTNIIKNQNVSDTLKRSGYGKYIISLINKFKLSKQIRFVGPLNENQMIDEYRKAHIFICPSSIENSPNSIGEAQILGVPLIAAYAGGIPDMVQDGETGLLYRFEEVEMLAANIKRLFNDKLLAEKISSNSITVANKRHDIKNNFQNTLNIYSKIFYKQKNN